MALIVAKPTNVVAGTSNALSLDKTQLISLIANSGDVNAAYYADETNWKRVIFFYQDNTKKQKTVTMFDVSTGEGRFKTSQKSKYNKWQLRRIVIEDKDNGLFTISRKISSATSALNSQEMDVISPNVAPTAVMLAAASGSVNNGGVVIASIQENTRFVGNLASVDINANDAHTFTIVSSEDSEYFEIIGNNALYLKADADFESKNSYTVIVRATDAEGLFFDQTVTINISNVIEPPNSLSVSSNEIVEFNQPGDVVAVLAAVDPEGGGNNQFTFELIAGEGSTNNDLFYISGNKLKAKKLFTSSDINSSSSSVRIKVTSPYGTSSEQIFTFSVLGSSVGTLDSFFSYKVAYSMTPYEPYSYNAYFRLLRKNTIQMYNGSSYNTWNLNGLNNWEPELHTNHYDYALAVGEDYYKFDATSTVGGPQYTKLRNRKNKSFLFDIEANVSSLFDYSLFISKSENFLVLGNSNKAYGTYSSVGEVKIYQTYKDGARLFQTISIPDGYEIHSNLLFGSNVFMSDDETALFITAKGVKNSDTTSTGSIKGAVFVYKKQIDGSWSFLHTIYNPWEELSSLNSSRYNIATSGSSMLFGQSIVQVDNKILIGDGYHYTTFVYNKNLSNDEWEIDILNTIPAYATKAWKHSTTNESFVYTIDGNLTDSKYKLYQKNGSFYNELSAFTDSKEHVIVNEDLIIKSFMSESGKVDSFIYNSANLSWSNSKQDIFQENYTGSKPSTSRRDDIMFISDSIFTNRSYEIMKYEPEKKIFFKKESDFQTHILSQLSINGNIVNITQSFNQKYFGIFYAENTTNKNRLAIYKNLTFGNDELPVFSDVILDIETEKVLFDITDDENTIAILNSANSYSFIEVYTKLNNTYSLHTTISSGQLTSFLNTTASSYLFINRLYISPNGKFIYCTDGYKDLVCSLNGVSVFYSSSIQSTTSGKYVVGFDSYSNLLVYSPLRYSTTNYYWMNLEEYSLNHENNTSSLIRTTKLFYGLSGTTGILPPDVDNTLFLTGDRSKIFATTRQQIKVLSRDPVNLTWSTIAYSETLSSIFTSSNSTNSFVSSSGSLFLQYDNFSSASTARMYIGRLISKQDDKYFHTEDIFLPPKDSADLSKNIAKTIATNSDASVFAKTQSATGQAGANIHVYIRGAEDDWSLQETIYNSASDFGDTLSLSGDGNTLAVGGSFGFHQGNSYVGIAYVYSRSGNTWTLQQTFNPSNIQNFTSEAKWGKSVALSADGLTMLISESGYYNSFYQNWFHVYKKDIITNVWSFSHKFQEERSTYQPKTANSGRIYINSDGTLFGSIGYGQYGNGVVQLWNEFGNSVFLERLSNYADSLTVSDDGLKVYVGYGRDLTEFSRTANGTVSKTVDVYDSELDNTSNIITLNTSEDTVYYGPYVYKKTSEGDWYLYDGIKYLSGNIAHSKNDSYVFGSGGEGYDLRYVSVFKKI